MSKTWIIEYNGSQIASTVASSMREQHKESIYTDDVVFFYEGKPLDVKKLTAMVKS